MGFLKKLLGGDKKEPPAKYPSRPTPPKKGGPAPGRRPAPDDAPDLSEMTPRQLMRLLGSASRETREGVAMHLGAAKDRSAMRQVLNTYLNHGDPGVLTALEGYGTSLASAALHEAKDLGVIGERRARLLDVLGITGSEEAVPLVRECVKDRDRMIRARACAALVKLGDLNGVSELADDLGLNDAEMRTLALRTLSGIDAPDAKAAIQEHLRRYLADSGAVPDQIEVSAPRLLDPSTNTFKYVMEHVKQPPHTLTIVIGSEAIRYASRRQEDVERALDGFDIHYSSRRLAPEEQIGLIEEARDAAAANPDARIAFVGQLPAPHDSPPLPHFLHDKDGGDYTVKVIVVDPHELSVVMDWWHYIVDMAKVPTELEVIQVSSTPERSGITEEEYALLKMTPEDKYDAFIRSFLAHT